jgi:branched-chain amino acid transport system ATP-binding protein
MALLTVENLRVCYGDLVAVRNVSFSVEQSDVFVLLGANGAGKTSILRCISGLEPPSAGRVTSDALTLSGLRPHRVALAGIAHVPEGRRVFATLTVEENLTVSFIRARASGTLIQARDEVYEIFPRLQERRNQAAGTLSGGEQQMLAIGRALMNAPTLLMLDEPSLGLSPLMAELMFERLSVIRATGTAILLVEQNAACLEMATRGLIIANGSVVLAGDRQHLHDADFVRAAYLGL